MVTFTRVGTSPLYRSETGVFFLFADGTSAPQTIEAAASFGRGFYAFALEPTNAAQFAASLRAAFNAQDATVAAPRVGWVRQDADPNVVLDVQSLVCAAGRVKRQFRATFGNIILNIPANAAVSFDAASSEIRVPTLATAIIASGGVPASTRNAAIAIPMTGTGGLEFVFEADKRAFDALELDLRYHGAASSGFALFEPLATSQTVALRGVFDPRVPFDIDRTFMQFTRATDDLPTFLRTDVGHPVRVTPAAANGLEGVGARLVMQRQPAGATSLVPHGSFAMSVPTAPDAAEHRLLGGTSGTEVIGFAAGDSLTFTANMPARVDPTAGAANVLTSERTTAYAHITPAGDRPPDYFAQPLEAGQFGRSGQEGVLEYREHTLRTFDAAAMPPVPLVPFAGAKNVASIASFLAIESETLARVRRDEIGRVPVAAATALEGVTEVLSTPQGLLANYAGGIWRDLVLASTPIRVQGNVSTLQDLKFTFGADHTFREALQHEKLFLVISDYARVGATLQSSVSIKGWQFSLDMGAEAATTLSQGRRLILFKFFDKKLSELVENTNFWTAPGSFNSSPAKTARELHDFIAEARAANDPLFADFLRKVDDPHWNGILALNCGINPRGLPEQARGLVAGIDFSQFRAHHFGIEINKVGSDIAIEESSLFALIRYRGSHLQDRGAYKFDVPDVTVRFANSQIRDFRCKILLTAGELFDEPTSGPPNNTITLTGRYEFHDGKDVYTFTRETEDVFALPSSNILESVTLTKVQFSTVSDSGSEIVARFAIWGSLRCRNLNLFDILTFNKLQYADLGLIVRIDSPPDHDPSITAIDFDPGTIRFDVSVSEKRSGGLLDNFPLKLKGLTFAKSGFKLPDLGYFRLALPDAPELPALPRYGLSFDLDLGSLGSLVSSIKGFKAEILFAWQPGSPGFDFGIKLPESSGGRKEIGIEGVIKLIVDDFRFEKVGPAERPVYFLQLQCCRVEILGRELPPDGQLNVYLFADPQRLSIGQVGWYVGYAPDDSPLTYFGLGQHVTPDPSLHTFSEILDKLRGIDANTKKVTCGKDDTATRTAVSRAVRRNVLQYRPDLDWLVAAKFTIADVLDLGFIFNDPELYALFLRIKPIKFSFEITYRKITENVGVYSTEIGLPEAWRQIEMGAVSLTLPYIGIELFTNGDFRVDVGFPRELDFSRSFAVQALPFIGAGGLYFGKLSGATTKFPNLQGMDIVYEVGFGMKLGLGKEFRKGILRAGLSIAFYGLLEGGVGIQKASLSDGGLPVRVDAYFLQGRFGVVGEIFGVVDFGIMKASILIRLFAGIGVRLATQQATQLWIEAGVTVDIDFVIAHISTWFGDFDITIHLSFSTQVRFAWTLGQSDSAGFAALDAFDGPKLISWTPLTINAAKQPLELFFVPDLTLVQQRPHFVANLLIGDSFAPMVRALARWTLRKYIERIGGDPAITVLGRADFTALNDLLHAPVSLARPLMPPAPGEAPQPAEGVEGLTYANIAQFLQDNFDVVIRTAPVNTAIQAVHFPAIPYLAVHDDGGATLTQFHESLVGDTYQDAVHTFFESLYVNFRRQVSDAVMLEEERVPLAEIVFQDYFDLLIKAAVEDLALPFEQDPDLTETIAQIVPDTRTFQKAGGMATRFFRHGLRLPTPENLTVTKPLYELTGQQFTTAIPQNGAATFTFHLARSGVDPKDGWFRLDGDPRMALRRAALPRLEALTLTPTLTQLRPLPLVRKREVSFALQQQVVARRDGITQRIWILPTALRTTLVEHGELALTLQKSDPLMAKLDVAPPSIPHTFATVVEIPIRRIALPGATPLASIYQIDGVSEASRRMLDALLVDASVLATARLALFAPDEDALRADAVNPAEVFLVKTNHSTESNPPQLEQNVDPAIASASLDEPARFLTLVQQCSIVNTGGFYLHYAKRGCVPAGNDDTCGFTFKGDRVVATLLIEFPQTVNASVLHNAIVVDAAAADPQNDLLYLRSRLETFDVTMEAGCAGVEVLRVNPDRNAAADDARELEKQYNLLELALRPLANVWTATPDALPAGPLQPPEDHPDAAIIAAAAAGDWYYQQVLPLHRFFAGAGDAANPYRHVARDRFATIDFDFRDSFGNRLGFVPALPLKLPALYFDPLIALSDWPAVEYRYDFRAADANAVFLTIDFVKDAFEKLAAREGETVEAFRQRQIGTMSDALQRYQRIFHQLQGPGVSVSTSTTLGASRSNLDLPRLTEFVQRVRCYLCARLRALGASTPFCDSLVGCNDTTQPIGLPVRIDVQPSAKVKFEMRVDVAIARDAALVDPGVSGKVPAATRVTTAVPAPIGATRGDGPTVTPTTRELATRFESAFNTFKFAVGAAADGTSAWWAVGKVLVTCRPTVATGALPFYFAPRPLLNRLWSQRRVVIPKLGAEPDEVLDFTDVDLDGWMRDMAGVFEDYLRPESAIAARKNDAAAFQTIMDAKKAIAGKFATLVRRLLQTPADPRENARDANEKYRQRVLLSLSEAYAIDTIVQLPVEVARAAFELDDPVAPRMYGRVTRADIAGNDPDFSFSTAKITYADDGRSTLTFLVDAKREKEDKAPELTLTYTITHLEHHIQTEPESGGDSGYDRSEWLHFPNPVTIPLGQRPIPIALREYPVPPVLVEQSGDRDVPVGTAATLQNARRWKYGFTIEYPVVAQDVVRADVIYNTPILAAAFENERTLPEALARFRVKYRRDLSAPAFAILALDIASSNWDFDVPVATFDGEPSDAYLLSDDKTTAGCTRASVRFIGPGTPVAQTLRLTATECTTSACGGPDPAPTNVLAQQTYRCAGAQAALAVRRRAISLGELDVLSQENAWAGVQIVRNSALFRDAHAATQTDHAFVYRTPIVRFGHPLTPLLDLQDVIAVPSTTKKPLQTLIAQMLTDVLGNTSLPSHTLKIEVRFGHPLTGGVNAEVPVLLVSALEIPVNGAVVDGGAAKLLADGINAWRNERHPHITDGAFLNFDLAAFASLGSQSGTVPVLRLRRVRISFHDVL
jgi:hypothetical protein